jgi:hypothetical protein
MLQDEEVLEMLEIPVTQGVMALLVIRVELETQARAREEDKGGFGSFFLEEHLTAVLEAHNIYPEQEGVVGVVPPGGWQQRHKLPQVIVFLNRVLLGLVDLLVLREILALLEPLEIQVRPGLLDLRLQP